MLGVDGRSFCLMATFWDCSGTTDRLDGKETAEKLWFSKWMTNAYGTTPDTTGKMMSYKLTGGDGFSYNITLAHTKYNIDNPIYKK